MPVAANATEFPVYSFKINEVTPLWFFCEQTGHCEQGMVMAINVNASSPNTFDAFVNNAKNATSGSAAASTATATGGMVTSVLYGSTATGAASASATSTSTVTNSAGRQVVSGGVLLAAMGLVAGLVL